MEQKIKVINAKHTLPSAYLLKVWRFRSLAFTFAWQELKVQYTQTIFGALWAFLRPLMILLIFTFIFDTLLPINGLKYPYPLFAFSGLIAWNYFSFIVNNGGTAIASNQQLIRKIYFPKIILVISKVLVGSIEFAVSVFLMLCMILILRFPISANLVWLPVFLLMNIITGFTVAIWLNALSIKFRDLNHFMPQLIGFLIWLTPVFYPITKVPPTVAFLFLFNPLVGIVQGYRFAILGDVFPAPQYLYSFGVVVLFLIFGLLLFIRGEDEMPDYL